MRRIAQLQVPIVLLGLACGAYGVFIFQQGIHWDDWGFIWLIQGLGTPGFIDYFSTNRPFLAYVYPVTSALLGTHVFAWHLFALFWRSASAISLWWVLHWIWPNRKRATFLVAAFFLVYPGFNQQAIAITYGHFFLAETFLFLSMAMMLLFIRQPRKYWWAGLLGVGCSAYNLFATEYFFGLELLRPILLWYGLRTLWPAWNERLKRLGLYYTPFFLTLTAYLYWRIFILGFHLYRPELFAGQETSWLDQLSHIPGLLWEQWQVAIWQAWGQVFQIPDFAEFGSRLSILYVVLFLVIAIGVYHWMNRVVKNADPGRGISMEWIGLGILTTVLAGIPFLVTELPLRLTFPNSRFTLPFALGAAFLLVVIIEALPKKVNGMAFASVLLALAVGVQFNNGFLWRDDWKLQTSLMWQMTWRIPALEEGTILVSNETPFLYSSDNSFTFPLNMTYAREKHATTIDYVYYSLSARLGNQLKALKPGLPVSQDYLATTFQSSSNEIVVVHFAPPGCFRVLDPVYDRDVMLAPARMETAGRWTDIGVPVLPQSIAKALPLSNLNQILLAGQGSATPPELFGPEPARKWCYYFETADLARQQGDWAAVARIGDEVFAIPYYPDNLSEYLPFVEAYGRMGREEDALLLTRNVADQMPILKPALCAVWRRIQEAPSAGIPFQRIDKIEQELGYCPYP